MAEYTPTLKDYALTTVSRLNSFLGTSFEEDDAKTFALINAVTEFVERYCGRRFQLTNYVEVYSVGYKEDAILLNQFPLVVDDEHTFTFEFRRSSQNEDDWDVIEAEEYFVDVKQGIIKPLYGSSFNDGTQNYRVSYSAGYDFDNSTAFLSDTEAGDVELAVWKIIGAVLGREKESGIESERIGDYQVVFRSILDQQSDIKDLLFPHRKMGLSGMSSPRPF